MENSVGSKASIVQQAYAAENAVHRSNSSEHVLSLYLLGTSLKVQWFSNVVLQFPQHF